MTRGEGVGAIEVRVAAAGSDGRAALARTVAGLRAAWGAQVRVATEDVGGDAAALGRAIRRWCDRDGADVVLTVGAAGHRREDFAPETTARLLERRLPGIEERMCLAPPRNAEDLLFRGRAGIRGRTVVVNLPARPGRAAQIARILARVLPHAIEKIRGSDRECGGGGG